VRIADDDAFVDHGLGVAAMCKVDSPDVPLDEDDGQDRQRVAGRVVAAPLHHLGQLSEVSADPAGKLDRALHRVGLGSLSLDADGKGCGGQVAEGAMRDVDVLAGQVGKELRKTVIVRAAIRAGGETLGSWLQEDAVVDLVLAEGRVAVVVLLLRAADGEVAEADAVAALEGFFENAGVH